MFAGGRQLGDIVRKNGSEEILFFHTDHQESVQTITTNTQGSYQQQFDPFGAIVDPNSFGFDEA